MRFFLLQLLFLSALQCREAGSTCVTDRNQDHRPRESCTGMGLHNIPPNLNLSTEVLNFTDNRFALLSWVSYKDFFKLYELDLSKNEVSMFMESSTLVLPTLKILRLVENRLQKLHPDSFAPAANLMEIYLKGNQLCHLSPESFTGLHALEVLDLSKNVIMSLPPNLLKLLPSTILKTFDVEDNKITILPDLFFDSKTQIPYVYLSKNPWVCSCSVDYLSKWLEEEMSNVYIHTGPNSLINDPESVVCDSPSSLRLKPIIDLTEDQYCPQTDGATMTPPILISALNTPEMLYNIHTTVTPQASTAVTPTTVNNSIPLLETTTLSWSWWYYTTEHSWEYVTRTNKTFNYFKGVISKMGKITRWTTHEKRTTPSVETTPPARTTPLEKTSPPAAIIHPVNTTPPPQTTTPTNTTRPANTTPPTNTTPPAKTTPPTNTMPPANTTPPTNTTPPAKSKPPINTTPPAKIIPLAKTVLPIQTTPPSLASPPFAVFEEQMLSSEGEGPVQLYCWWLFMCDLCLCILLGLWLCAVFLWLLRTYLQVYLPLSRRRAASAKQAKHQLKAESPAQQAGTMERCSAAFKTAAVSLPAEGSAGAQAVFRSVLFVSVSNEGEGGAQRSTEISLGDTPTAARGPDRGSVCVTSRTGEERFEESEEVFRKTLYRVVSREGEARRCQSVWESCELSDQGPGPKQRAGELKTRYSLVLREERGESGLAQRDSVWSSRHAPENEWLVGEWEWNSRERVQGSHPFSLIPLIGRGSEYLSNNADASGETNHDASETRL